MTFYYRNTKKSILLVLLSLFSVISLLFPVSSYLIVEANATPENDFDECAGENTNDPFCPGAGGGGSSNEENEEEEQEREEEEEQDFDECEEDPNAAGCPDSSGSESNSNEDAGGKDSGGCLFCIEEDTNSSLSNTAQGQGQQEQKFLTYTNSKYGITMQYPFGWHRSEEDPSPENTLTTIVTFSESTTGYTGDLWTVIHPDQNLSVDEYLSNTIAEYKEEYKNFKLMSYSNETGQTFAGNPAYKLEFTFENEYTDSEDTVVTRSLEIGTKVGNDFYYAAYIAEDGDSYDKTLPIAQKMIDSIQITGQEQPATSASLSQTTPPSQQHLVDPEQTTTTDPSQSQGTSVSEGSLLPPGNDLDGQQEIQVPDTNAASNLSQQQEPSSPATVIEEQASIGPPVQPLTPPLTTQSTSGGQMLSTVSTELLTFEHPTDGYTIQYPSNWHKIEEENSTSFDAPLQNSADQNHEVISITTEILPTSDYSLDRYTEAGLGQVESFQDFKLLNSSSTSLAGLPAHMIVYSFTDEESQTPLQNLQTWTVSNGIAYVVTYGGVVEQFSDSMAMAEKMINSFTIKKAATTSEQIEPHQQELQGNDFSQEQSTASQPSQAAPSSEQQITTGDSTQLQEPPTPEPSTDSGFQTYENSTLGFKIQHPSNSSVTERGDIVAFSLPESYLLVRVSNLTTPGMSLENYSSITINALSESRTGFNIEQQDNSSQLAGNPAFKIIYTDNQTDSERKSLQTWTIANDKAYDLTYVTDTTNFDTTLPIAQEMINSFQILGQEVAATNVATNDAVIQEQSSVSDNQSTQTPSLTGENTSIQDEQQALNGEQTLSESEQTTSLPSSSKPTTTPTPSETTTDNNADGTESTETSSAGEEAETPAPESETPSSISVSITSSSFEPPEIQVKAGDIVTWTNDDSSLHTVTSGDPETATADGKFDTGLIGANQQSKSVTMPSEPGEYSYFCTLHPEQIGTVIVS